MGTYTSHTGSKYHGQWQENRIHGFGRHTWPDGRSYMGQWRNNRMHGIGYYQWADGRFYIGQYANHQKNGYGIYRFANGSLYSGYWARGKANGLGIISKDGSDGSAEIKYGVWEEGGQNHWLDHQQVKEIIAGKGDSQQYFQKYKNALASKKQSFVRPGDFDKMLELLE